MESTLEPVTAQEKPCLVAAGQGFSVSYKGKSLYSRYAPQKAVLQTVANLQLLPGTLIICASPCLWYGLQELLDKLPESCFVLAMEFDAALHAFAKEELCKQPFAADSRLHFLPYQAFSPQKRAESSATPEELASTAAAAITTAIATVVHYGGDKRKSPLPPLHTFRRAILVELSGGTQFNKPLYSIATAAAENTIATFWKNRLTLTRFGRLYSRNLFKNLANATNSIPFSQLQQSVKKPILLFGAGESTESTLCELPRSALKAAYIIAVDAALPILSAHGVTCDCVVAVESQLAIEAAYIGNTHQTPLILADIVSRPQVTKHVKKAKLTPEKATPSGVCYFFSKYTDASFLSELQAKSLLPKTIPPLGSVGLTATYLALLLRADTTLPIFVTGLDFSFSLGLTHARGAPAHIQRLIKSNRKQPSQNMAAAFKNGAKCMQGKTGPVYTDLVLSSYAEQFATTFSGCINLFDAAKSGLPLGIPRIGNTELLALLVHAASQNAAFAQKAASIASTSNACKNRNDAIRTYLQNEQQALERLKQLLIHGEAAKAENMSVQEELTALITPREYLYLHFPDGYQCRPQDVSFLKRVRSEIDFFLKDITRGLNK